VTITHDDPSAEIRYTLDGSRPGAKSPRYENPLTLAESTTLRARAFRVGRTRSIIVQETFLITDEESRELP
jgi:hypothetical protein